jgi:uncharacterized DUF497 family protein
MEYTERDGTDEFNDRFDWDEHNAAHIADEHGVTVEEAEELFDDEQRLFVRRSDTPTESRWMVIGRTFAGRLLVAIYTWRNGKIRVVTVREPNGGESSFWSRRRS